MTRLARSFPDVFASTLASIIKLKTFYENCFLLAWEAGRVAEIATSPPDKHES
jgi:hypothetical protein